ncbi:MAG: hypothetical protein RR636_09190 [Clostridium sp.]
MNKKMTRVVACICILAVTGFFGILRSTEDPKPRGEVTPVVQNA